MNLILLFLIFWWVVVNENDGLKLALIAGVLMDLANNLLLGSSVAGFGLVLLTILLYKRLISKLGLKESLPLAIFTSFAWQYFVFWLNRAF